jgi:hypothetical protein
LSYVIQNFYTLSKHIVVTPKFKYLILLKNINLLFIFFKTNLILFLIKQNNFLHFTYFSLFFKYFFSKSFIKIINKINLKLNGTYSNNTVKSTIFYFFKNLSFNLTSDNNDYLIKNLNIYNTLLFNHYFLSIKLINLKINKKLYKNFFFYLILFNSFI